MADMSDIIVAGEHVIEYATEEFIAAIRQAVAKIPQASSWSPDEIDDIIYG